MSVVKSQNIIAKQSTVTLRDAQHAHNFYTSNNFEFVPKTKFLYHVVFTLSEEARLRAVNTERFGKQISILVKSADLPNYSVSTETKKQYNRNKHFQTAIEYSPVSAKFHDDNLGVTSRLLEEYYRYYYLDGRKFINPGEKIDFGSRDLYNERVPSYGLDQGPKFPFFENIKIFQLSRQTWRGYTLINPLIESWSHDSLDYSDSASTMENTISIMYEGVLYSDGVIKIDNNPPGFGALETLYDYTPSPLGTDADYPGYEKDLKIAESKKPATNTPLKYRNPKSLVSDKPFSVSQKDPGGYPNIIFPTKDSSEKGAKLSNSREVINLDSERILSELGQNAKALESFTNKSVMTGLIKGYNVNSFEDYKALNLDKKNAIKDQLLEGIKNKDPKLLQIASDAIKKNKSLTPVTGQDTILADDSRAQFERIFDRINTNVQELDNEVNQFSSQTSSALSFSTNEQIAFYNERFNSIVQDYNAVAIVDPSLTDSINNLRQLLDQVNSR